MHWKGALVIVAHDRYFLDKVGHAHLGDEVRRAGRLPRATTRLSLSSARCAASASARSGRRSRSSVEKTEEFIRRNLAGQRTREAQGRRTRLERFLRDEAIDRPREEQTRFAWG